MGLKFLVANCRFIGRVTDLAYRCEINLYFKTHRNLSGISYKVCTFSFVNINYNFKSKVK